MRLTHNSTLISTLLAVLLLLVGGSQALSWTVRFRSYEANSCFFINVAEASQTISIYYNVHENKQAEIGHKIDYVVASPNGQQLMAEPGVNYKDFKIQPVMAGRHSICFKHNGSPTEKVLDIDVSLTKPLDSHGNGKPGELIPVSPTAEVERVNRKVKEDLTSLFHSLKNMKDREKGNQFTVKSILKLMKWFSLFQVVSVVGIGYAHVYVLKTFFTNNAKTRV